MHYKSADEIRMAVNKLKSENKDYQDWVYAGTNASSRIRSRVNAVMDILNKITLADSSNAESRQRLFDQSLKSKLFYEGYVCQYCGNKILSVDDCEIDHIIPFDMGGPTELENAQLLHKWCNRSKGNHMQTESYFEDDSMDDESDSN